MLDKRPLFITIVFRLDLGRHLHVVKCDDKVLSIT